MNGIRKYHTSLYPSHIEPDFEPWLWNRSKPEFLRGLRPQVACPMRALP